MEIAQDFQELRLELDRLREPGDACPTDPQNLKDEHSKMVRASCSVAGVRLMMPPE
jgi:hypothetical protein